MLGAGVMSFCLSQVGSPLVEHAWETLCGSIIQEVILPATNAEKWLDCSVPCCGGLWRRRS